VACFSSISTSIPPQVTAASAFASAAPARPSENSGFSQGPLNAFRVRHNVVSAAASAAAAGLL